MRDFQIQTVSENTGIDAKTTYAQKYKKQANNEYIQGLIRNYH